MADKEKCYGIGKARKNDCASATGVHSLPFRQKSTMTLVWKFQRLSQFGGDGEAWILRFRSARRAATSPTISRNFFSVSG